MGDCEHTGEEGEILFFEDRTPGNVTSVERRNEDTKPQNYIGFGAGTTESPQSPDDSERGILPILDETDNNPFKPIQSTESIQTTDGDKTDDDILYVEEDRNPILTGLETYCPRYDIKEHFLKLHEESTPQPKRNKLANSCWNCGETTHALRDCPEPRNHAKISRCRREFQESRGPQVVYKRYHVEESQVFGHLVPGQLSKGLRQALGLEEGQLPSHIYRMRQLGYPPGWLLEAKVSHSGISMFDGQGQEVNDPDTEVGEVVEAGSLDKYDIRKIVHYPGFNVPPPPDTYDDSEYWRCPPQSHQQSVEVMLARLEGKVVGGYKRKKLSLNTMSSDQDDTSQSVESQEMEYEEIPEGQELPVDHCKFVPPLPEEDLPPPPPSELPTEPDSDSVLSASVDETSLNELEEAKKQLLAQLNDTTPVCGTPESRIGKVKSVDLGTPLLSSVSPYAKLPSAEKFSTNICDVINFENLPDSTGKYEKMSGIIRKVRHRLSEINDES